MTREVIEAVASAGVGKLSFLEKRPMRFLCRAAVAGFFIVIGTLLSILSSAWVVAESAGAAKLLAAGTFSAALALIVLLGGELFTGANLVMGITYYEKRTKFSGVLRVWAMCYIGNLLGIVILCSLISASGAASTLITETLIKCIPPKLSTPWYQLLLKAIMCNFLVCIGVYSGFKLKSEGGKYLIIFFVISTFVLAGFEHSIANMAYFSLAAMLLPSPDFVGMLMNLLWVTLGNIIGGALLLGLPLWLSAEPKE